MPPLWQIMEQSVSAHPGAINYFYYLEIEMNMSLPLSRAGVAQTAFGVRRSGPTVAWVLVIMIWGLQLAGCTNPPTRPVLGAFTGDEREITYLDQVRRRDSSALQTPESVHNALSFYRDMKFQQRALFLRFHRQYPEATPQEMATLVQDALPRETRSDLPNIPPPAFQCFSVNAGKTQSLSCN